MMRKVVLTRLPVNHWLTRLLTMPLLAFFLLTTTPCQMARAEMAQNLGKSRFTLVADAALSNACILNNDKDFYIFGRPFREGKIAAAYDDAYLTVAQQQFTSSTTFTWAYPPPLSAALPLFRLPLLALVGWRNLGNVPLGVTVITPPPAIGIGLAAAVDLAAMIRRRPQDMMIAREARGGLDPRVPA